MSATRPGQLLRHLHPADPDDRSLLARFAGRRDPAAFASLVRRHGPMVYAVCRRVTGHPQDAEDAFQAAFLVLARKAGVVRDPDRLGAWLYGVAVKVAGRARYVADRRRRREVQVPARPDIPVTDDPPPLDIGPALHEELAALPAHHREPIVLCDLQGLSRADAAKALGIPEGTLSSRLANGRKRLADRLTRRGVALALAAVPGAVAHGCGVVPEALVANTCGLVAAWAAGEVVPAAVLRLARGVFPMRSLLLGGVVSLSLAAGAVLAAGLADSPTDDPPRPPEPLAVLPAGGSEAQPQPKEDDNPGPDRFGPPQLTQKLNLRLKDARRLAWSPDGEWLAVSGTASWEPQFDEPSRVGGGNEIALVAITAGWTPVVSAALPPGGRLVGFTADGKRLLTATTEVGLISGSDSLQLWTASSHASGPRVSPEPRLTSGPTFNIPDRATALTPIGGTAVWFLVPEYTKDGIARATVRGLDFRDKKGSSTRGKNSARTRPSPGRSRPSSWARTGGRSRR
jgi:RNA polymerase sigma factor (sigma-70 family)